MKKFFSLMIVIAMITAVLAVPFSVGATFADSKVLDSLHSDVYYLQSLDDDTVFFEKNADKKMPAAAFIKLIASVVAIEKWGNLDEKVTVTKENLSLVKYDYGIRTAKYKEGEKVSKKELIDCLIVYSANDAVSIIAKEVSGSLGAFIGEMQALADKIGCKTTKIKNIHGFDEDGQYTTAKDVAKFMKYALTYPVFSEAISADSVTLKGTSQNDERTYLSSNKMKNSSISDYYHSSVTGGKYTATDEAGECAAIVTNMDGYSYLAVTLGGKLKNVDNDSVKENTCFTDIKNMILWVYENIRYRVIASQDQTAVVVPVKAGKDTDKVRLVPEKEISALVPASVTPASVMFEIVEGSVKKDIVAPVKAGQVMGQAKIYYAGTELATINLVAAQDVQRSFTGYIMTKISSLVGSTAFMILTILLFLASVAYLVMMMSKFYGWDKKLVAVKGALDTVTNGKKAPAKRPPQKKAVTKSVPTKKAPARKAPANKTPVKKVPANKTKVPVKKQPPKGKMK